MAIVRRRSSEAQNKGRIDIKRFNAITEADIERWDVEDDYNEANLGPVTFVPALVDVRELRERLRLSQEAFAERFMLPLRTVQEWEQRRREPSIPARVLLYAISRDPDALQSALSGKTKSNGKRKASRG